LRQLGSMNELPNQKRIKKIKFKANFSLRLAEKKNQGLETPTVAEVRTAGIPITISEYAMQNRQIYTAKKLLIFKCNSI